ncbi:hypothetical protein LJC26_01850 [Desulfovibrio sp. OttesenSCG-928-O18]|nr:hypothetical protein [Desulfovibrio sp. OttesenSCG-928-O18]
MTISSIYTNQPGAVGKPGDLYAPETREATAGIQSGRETLQEVTDQAKLSSVAPKIQAMLSEMAASENNVIDTLSGNIDRLQDGFIETLYTALSEEGIDLSQKMTLRLDGSNALIVAGDHPEKERVDKILAGQPALSSAFGEIAAQSEVLRDITNINKVMTRQAGMDAYSAAEQGAASATVYQMSLKGEMSHFYFSRG